MSVTEILLNKYGIVARAGRKIECPFCGHHTMSVKTDDALAKCFHTACGRYITPFQKNSFYENSFHQVFEEIYHDLHKELLDKYPQTGRAYKYLVEERKIHPKVVGDSMLGAVPLDYDIDKRFEAMIAEIKTGEEKSKPEGKGKRGRPKKEKITPEEKLEQIEKIKEKWNKAARPGWLAFFYLNKQYHIVSIRFRKPYFKEMYFFKPFEKTGMGLFGHQLFTPIKLPGSVKNKNDYTTKIEERYEDFNSRLFVTEGEFNSLQLQSLMVRVAELKESPLDYVFCCSVGGAGCADFECIKAIARQPIFVYDNDAAGLAMVKRAQDFMNLTAFTVPDSVFDDSDLDDFIKRFGDNYLLAFAEIKKLIKARAPFPRTYQSLAIEIYLVRQYHGEGDSRRPHEIHHQVAEIILKDLLERGTFYHDGQTTYLFFELEKELFALHRDGFECQNLLAKYGLMSSETIYRYIIDFLQAEAFQNGILTEIHRFAYFNKETFTIYLFNHCNQIYRISPENIELQDNGFDQVLFLSDSSSEPFEISLDESICAVGKGNGKTPLLKAELIDKINFAEDVLTIAERRLLFRYYFLSLFFESLMPTKIIACFVGEKGSGKSITLRKIGMLLFGSKFDVKSLPNSEGDFDTVALNTSLFFIDNADQKCPWLDDRLARIATGAVISKRELYTTNRMFSKAAKCFLGITSRTPHFRRDDVSDRLLLMPVKRFDKIIPENILLSAILENRNAIMAETALLLQKAIRALKKWKDVQEMGSFRMADFYSFTIKIARYESNEERLKNIFDKMIKEQSLFTLGYDIVYELLSDWVNLESDNGFGEKISNSQREVTSNALNAELAELAEKKGIGYFYKDKSRAFAQRLSNILSNLQEFLTISVREGRGRTKIFSFALKQENVDAHPVKEDLPF